MNKPDKQKLAEFLRQIPQSNEDALTLADLADDRSDEAEIRFLCGCAHMLDLIGVVQFTPGLPAGTSRIKASAQTAKYTLMSLASYLEADIPIITDWKGRGVHQEAGEILANGASFLYQLERGRLNKLNDAEPSRYERVAQIIIKRTNPQSGAAELLLQYDHSARQYQFIGGRWRDSDGKDLKLTAIREVEEELQASNLKYGVNYDLFLLLPDLTLPATLSPTFGALTMYRFWVFHMVKTNTPLILQENDRWVPVEDLLKGDIDISHTNSLFDAINAQLSGGLAQLTDSV